MTEQLSNREQLALMETINILPLYNIQTGTVEAHAFVDSDRVAVTFRGVVVIPAKQLESVRQVVETERMTRESKEGT